MDPRMVGLYGGIAGGVIGVMGGLIGTYVSVKNTHGPKERAFVVRAAVVCWLFVTAFLLTLGAPRLWPRPFGSTLGSLWMPLLWTGYLPSQFLFIRWANRGQDRARAEDEVNAGQAGAG
jgi:hypothetical protein